MMMKRSCTLLWSALLIAAVAASPNSRRPTSFKVNLPGRRYDDSDDDDGDNNENGPGLTGSGRDFDVFDTRPKGEFEEINDRHAKYTSSRKQRTTYKAYTPGRTTTAEGPAIFQTVREWWSANLPNIPKLIFRVEPTTTLKISKTFRPLGTIVKMGAEFNTGLGVWQFKSSWEDAIIGGKLTLAGKELQLTKSWQLSMGPVEDLVTRLRFRAAVDMQTMKAYARVGFRTERLSPINVMEGFTLRKKVPLSGNNGPIKMEIKANVALPEPEIEYSTENQRSLVGMGDIEVNIEELNLLLEY